MAKMYATLLDRFGQYILHKDERRIREMEGGFLFRLPESVVDAINAALGTSPSTRQP